MSTCEKCWGDASMLAIMAGCSVSTIYRRLLFERGEYHCEPEEMAGPEAGVCPICEKATIHQHTGEPMCGCPPTTKWWENDGN